jgi:hypothetical protein
MSALAIDIPSVPDFHDGDGAFFVLEWINYAIPSLPQPVAILARKLFAPLRPWIPCERLDATENLPQVLFGDAIEILLNRFLEEEAICGHLF